LDKGAAFVGRMRRIQPFGAGGSTLEKPRAENDASTIIVRAVVCCRGLAFRELESPNRIPAFDP
jgi:hypothetical protein